MNISLYARKKAMKICSKVMVFLNFYEVNDILNKCDEVLKSRIKISNFITIRRQISACRNYHQKEK